MRESISVVRARYSRYSDISSARTAATMLSKEQFNQQLKTKNYSNTF